MKLWNDLIRSLRTSLGWIAAQFWATLLLILAGVAWTRLPDKHVWQVLLSLVIPLLLAAGFLVLEAGTMRRLFGDDEGRARLWAGALTLLAWAVVWWIAWQVLNWVESMVPEWAGYLNSQSPARLRAKLLTYEHISNWLLILVWVCRWIVLPAKIVPHVIASAQWGWRMPWRKVWRMLLDWRWWPVPVAVALLSVLLPGHFIANAPHGTVSHQKWAVSFEMVGSYLLVVLGWVALLVWSAILLRQQIDGAEGAWDRELWQRLKLARRWMAWLCGATLVGVAADVVYEHLHRGSALQQAIVNYSTRPIRIAALLGVFAALVFAARTMVTRGDNKSNWLKAALSVLVWIIVGGALEVIAELLKSPVLKWILQWIAIPAVIAPWAVVTAQTCFRIPWKRVALLLANWRWWLGAAAAGTLSCLVPALFYAVFWNDDVLISPVREFLFRSLHALFEIGGWVLLFGWAALMFDRYVYSSNLPTETGDNTGGDA